MSGDETAGDETAGAMHDTSWLTTMSVESTSVVASREPNIAITKASCIPASEYMTGISTREDQVDMDTEDP